MAIVGELGLNVDIWQEILQTDQHYSTISDSQIHLIIVKVTLAALAKHEATSPGLRPTSLRPFLILNSYCHYNYHHLTIAFIIIVVVVVYIDKKKENYHYHHYYSLSVPSKTWNLLLVSLHWQH